MYTTEEIKELLLTKYEKGDFRILGGGNDKQQTKTVELQNIQFVANKDHIIRKPNYDYAQREIQWYHTMSLNVNDIPGGAPVMWKMCADSLGYINSNYGWMIFSKENGITISAYINQLRLKKSSEMLIFTDKSITEICFECGFRNLSYFLRNFKSKYKISPKQYQISKKSEKYYTPKL